MIQKQKNLYYRAYVRILRLFLPVLVVCFIISFSSLPAFAIAPPGKANNILDFKTSVATEGDAAIISGTIPLTNAQTRQEIITSKIVTYQQMFNKDWFHWDLSMGNIQVGSYLRSEIFPLGYFNDKNSSNLNKCISLVGLPNGTQFSLDARIGGIGSNLDFEETYKDTYYEVRILYIDAEGNSLNSQLGNTEYHYDTEHGPMIYTSFTIEAPSGAVAFRIQYKNQVRVTNTPSDFVYEDGVHLLYFRYIVNKLEYESALGDYNISQMGNKLDGIDDTLNDMANRPVDPAEPPESDTFEDIEDAETDLRDDAQAGLDVFENMTDDFESQLESNYGSALMVVATLIDTILDKIPALSTLVYISLVLGISAFVLSLSVTVVSRFGSSPHKATKETKEISVRR